MAAARGMSARCNLPYRSPRFLPDIHVQRAAAMYLLGHTDPMLTMAVYQQVLDLGDAGIKRLERLLGGRLDDIGQILCGRQPQAEWSPGLEARNSDLRRGRA
jgi:hypothetical protein